MAGSKACLLLSPRLRKKKKRLATSDVADHAHAMSVIAASVATATTAADAIAEADVTATTVRHVKTAPHAASR